MSVLLELFDHGNATKVVLKDSQTATGTTVSLIGHITETGLAKVFDVADMMTGFGNCGLWIHTERTKVLPVSDLLPKAKETYYSRHLRAALEFARTEAPEEYDFSPEAWDYWCELCDQWAEKQPLEVMKALYARARPHVRRIAIILAVAEQWDCIELDHLQAANAMFNYSAQTVEYLFADNLGNPHADRILRALRDHPAGMSRTEIHQLVYKKAAKAKEWMDLALKLLVDMKLVRMEKQRSGRQNVSVYIATAEH